MERVTVRYTGRREDAFFIRAGKGGRRYEVDGPGCVLEVWDVDWRAFPRQFFEVVEPPAPEEIRTSAPPLERAVVIDPADGISDAEAAAADSALRSYRKQQLGGKLDRIMAVDSADPDDYMEAAADKLDAVAAAEAQRSDAEEEVSRTLGDLAAAVLDDTVEREARDDDESD